MHSNINILSKKENGSSVVESILKSRGIVDLEDYFNPEEKELMSPFVFSDMQKAVDIIYGAIKNNDCILIWGDFDADGVTSTSILYKTLKALNANFIYFLPDRQKHGHGINLKELLQLKAKNNVKVLITVDCGISNIKEVELIKTMGVKTIITDHHEPLDILPNADCIINPLANNALKNDLTVSEIQKISYLAGAGIALKLSFALLGENYISVKKEVLALSSVGTISDVVPLVGENRIIAAKGLLEINNNSHLGIKKIFESQNITKEINSEDVAFILTPRINAAGRLDSPFESIKILIEDNDLAINMAIQKLDALNKIRQNLCEKTFDEALSMLKNPSDSIVLFNKDWHIGIIGIVASKLVERFNLPVFLITVDENNIYRCSIRGSKGYDISKILKSLEDCFLGYGGHSLAGGFSADSNLISIEKLTERINEVVSNLKDETKMVNSIDVDIELTGNDITKELFYDIKKMEPFGQNNKRPNFLIRNAKVISQRQIGKEQNHLSYSVLKDGCQFNCLYWKRKALGISNNELMDFVFKLEVNEFNNEEKIQLITDLIIGDKLEENFYKGTKFFDHRQKNGIYDKIDDYIKNKNGAVKTYISTIKTKKELNRFVNIVENNLSVLSKQQTIMLFDYPPTLEDYRELIKKVSPDNIHLMRKIVSKNVDEYILTLLGMLKYAHNNKKGEIDIKTLSKNLGLSDICVQILLELLEKIESIRILDVDKIEFIRAPQIDKIHTDSMFEIFKDEFDKSINFIEFLQNADIDEIEEISKI